jgi:hypothetical protein
MPGGISMACVASPGYASAFFSSGLELTFVADHITSYDVISLARQRDLVTSLTCSLKWIISHVPSTNLTEEVEHFGRLDPGWE